MSKLVKIKVDLRIQGVGWLFYEMIFRNNKLMNIEDTLYNSALFDRYPDFLDNFYDDIQIIEIGIEGSEAIEYKTTFRDRYFSIHTKDVYMHNSGIGLESHNIKIYLKDPSSDIAKYNAIPLDNNKLLAKIAKMATSRNQPTSIKKLLSMIYFYEKKRAGV